MWGAYILGIFGVIEAAWFISALLGFSTGLCVLAVPALLFGMAGAGYTALLFGQAEGRNFWQSPLLLPVLIVQAALGLLAWALNVESAITTTLTYLLLGALALQGLLVRLTPAKCGKRTNSGSNSPGASTPMAAEASVTTSSRPIVPVKS